MTIEEKKQHIQPVHPKLSIQRQCELIGLPRSSYYRAGLACLLPIYRFLELSVFRKHKTIAHQL
jgi:hypothetical protein